LTTTSCSLLALAGFCQAADAYTAAADVLIRDALEEPS
jgi:hypothetical protein